MTPKQLADWGEAITGTPDYKAPLARALGYNRKTVQRWAKGEWPIPPDLEEQLRDLAKGAAMRAALRQVTRLKELVK
jgi:hypothetical protein